MASTGKKRTTRGKKPRLLRIYFSLLFFLFLIGAIEICAALLVGRPTALVRKDRRLNHTWKPNSKITFDEKDAEGRTLGQYLHHFNAQGWIDEKDIQKQKPENTYRIFYLGDSFVQGSVPMSESLPSQVRKALNQKKPDQDLQYQVINTGTVSYSPVLEYILIRYYLSKYSPDMIVLNVDMTDDFDDWKYRKTLEVDHEGNPYACLPRPIYQDDFIETSAGIQKSTLSTKIILFLWKHSSTYHLLKKMFPVPAAKFSPVIKDRQHREELHSSGIYSRWAWCQHEWDQFTEDNAAFTLGTIRRIIDYCKKEKITLVIDSIPHYRQFLTDNEEKPPWSSRPHLEIKKLSAEKQIPYINSFESLRPLITGSQPTDYYHYRSMHFNPQGNTLWAKHHIDFLRNYLRPDINSG